jgi:uncharacterized protein (DUF934 family)
MQIIKDRQIIDDCWTHAADDDPVTTGNVTISLQRWQTDRQQLLNHTGKLGLRLSTEDRVEDIASDLPHFSLMELNFMVFTDGRSFSQAWLLRNRFHYAGEIRATGQLMRDQIYYLQRVGVNSFKLENNTDLTGTLSSLKDFSVNYQTSSG